MLVRGAAVWRIGCSCVRRRIRNDLGRVWHRQRPSLSVQRRAIPCSAHGHCGRHWRVGLADGRFLVSLGLDRDPGPLSPLVRRRGRRHRLHGCQRGAGHLRASAGLAGLGRIGQPPGGVHYRGPGGDLVVARWQSAVPHDERTDTRWPEPLQLIRRQRGRDRQPAARSFAAFRAAAAT